MWPNSYIYISFILFAFDVSFFFFFFLRTLSCFVDKMDKNDHDVCITRKREKKIGEFLCRVFKCREKSWRGISCFFQ